MRVHRNTRGGSVEVGAGTYSTWIFFKVMFWFGAVICGLILAAAAFAILVLVAAIAGGLDRYQHGGSFSDHAMGYMHRGVALGERVVGWFVP